MVLMTHHLKKLTGTLQFNTTQFTAFCFCVTRTTGNPVYAFMERLVGYKVGVLIIPSYMYLPRKELPSRLASILLFACGGFSRLKGDRIPWLHLSVVEIGRQHSGCCHRSLLSDRRLTDCCAKRVVPITHALHKRDEKYMARLGTGYHNLDL